MGKNVGPGLGLAACDDKTIIPERASARLNHSTLNPSTFPSTPQPLKKRMGKNKLKKFAEMDTMQCVYQFPYQTLAEGACPLRGHWRELAFHNDRPLVLELGCGKGEYAVGLGQRFPECNYVGIDVKGARMWTGAKQVTEMGLPNVAFLRTDIDLLDRLFAPDEVDELWITFADPQMKKVNKRLTGTRMMNGYRRVLRDGGFVNLKTDSPFLYTYTREMARLNNLPVLIDTDDLYRDGDSLDLPDGLLDIKTYYERQWLARGLTIKYLRLALPHRGDLVEPDIDIPLDTYRSFHRNQPSL